MKQIATSLFFCAMALSAFAQDESTVKWWTCDANLPEAGTKTFAAAEADSKCGTLVAESEDEGAAQHLRIVDNDELEAYLPFDTEIKAAGSAAAFGDLSFTKYVFNNAHEPWTKNYGNTVWGNPRADGTSLVLLPKKNLKVNVYIFASLTKANTPGLGGSKVLIVDPEGKTATAMEITAVTGDGTTITEATKSSAVCYTFDAEANKRYNISRNDGSQTDRLLGFSYEADSNELSGIQNVTVSEAIAEDAPAYNVYGQPVDSSYCGIVIRGGKKFFQK